MDDSLYLVWLNRIDGLGNKKQRLLLEEFQYARDVFFAPRRLLQTFKFLSEQNINKILSMQDERLLSQYQNQLEAAKMRFIPISSPEYPVLLKEIHEPPAGLYVVGQLPNPNAPTVSIIGSRKCSEYGLAVAERFSRDLARRGVVIVSGMARGVDSMSHRGALEGGGLTIAVLGCGADVCYPAENRSLMEKIKNQGCIISEYPPGTRPSPGFFPTRNRIISGLSDGIVVVEAAKRSGTLITVGQALDEGREVMAVPGDVRSRLSEGTNALIKDGATPVSSADEIISALRLEWVTEGQPSNNIDKNNNNISDSLAPEEKLVYDCIGFQPIGTDEIIRRTNSQPGTVNYILTTLELNGIIQRLPGHRFVRVE